MKNFLKIRPQTTILRPGYIHRNSSHISIQLSVTDYRVKAVTIPQVVKLLDRPRNAVMLSVTETLVHT